MNKKLTAIKKIILSLLCIWFLGSCSNDDGNNNEIKTENSTISNSDTYTYNLGSFGFEEGANFQKQAKNFEISELVRTGLKSEIIYKYKAKVNFIGTDYVEIWAGRGSDGASPNTNVKIIKIIITVTK
ncbi:MAG TPA: hypothetical protein PLT79_11250 [Flavobacterium sp.]|jgi:hypothetical protein|uniref:hypothetical protein n=1 Tax=Flavobacterium sp. TaxID=239 RepID=UPI001B5740E1|nr:hypothetical protein [Flavobacterium sp.]MBP7317901.1 hypothetical protein [Flavobacterium sp.]MBP8886431.1 hypothetical protein [Flavobacterium sp.]HRL72256.1 hypothetical protein [Flavobacterium sp.]HRM46610.1 hypothetical protein [Flavobacterium sp.]